MKKPTKILAVLLLLALTAALLCGCGGKATVTVTLESDVTLIPPAGGLDKLFASATTQMNRII
ncbi:MAG: hypothetical protein CW338_00990, partial [Clostridiales bacterium]|nr:hypothetical protein [Clostridiales bacterium]